MSKFALGDGSVVDLRLDYTGLQAAAKELLLKTEDCIAAALRDASLKPDQIQAVVMVGGSTRIPRVLELVKQIFGKEPNHSVNPDEVVAVGAAVQAGVLAGDVKGVLLLDVTPLSLGINANGVGLGVHHHVRQFDKQNVGVPCLQTLGALF